MNRLFLILMLVVALPCTSHAVSIVSVSVPQESQDSGNNDSYPSRDDIWTSSPVDTENGIGRLINTSEPLLAVDIDPATRFGVLHSHKYAAPFVPVASAVVTFVFDRTAIVSGIEMLQHMNGITRVEGFVGNDISSMISIGNVFGSAGDVRGHELFSEGESHLFSFENFLAGTIFQFRITQTSREDGYGLHRAFPLLSNGSRIVAAPDSGSTALMLGFATMAMWAARFSRRH